MSYVFVSYSHKDKVAVNRLVNTLKAAGYLIWLDHDTEAIPGGRSSRSPGYGKIVQGLIDRNSFVHSKPTLQPQSRRTTPEPAAS